MPIHGTVSHVRPRLLPLLVLATTGAAATLALAADPAPSGAGDADRGRKALERSAAAYVAAPGLVDVARLEIGVGAQPRQKVDIEYTFGTKSNALVKLPGLSATALDGRLYMERDDVPDKYLDVELDGDLATTMDAVLGADSNLPVQFDMRAGRTVDEFLPAFSMGALLEPRIAGYEMTDLQGAQSELVRVEGDNGETLIWIDPKTRLVRRVEIKAEMPAPQQAELSATIEYAPKISSKARVDFDPKDRQFVRSYDSLQPTRIGAGSMAPDFELETLDGERVRLRDLRGQVVVLDFWATWCGPCRRGLPLLQDFDDWVRANDKPVRVFAVDTFERGRTIEDWRKAAKGFWSKKSFTMPSLLDFENRAAIAYGVSGIPATFVIDRDGRVARVHQGFDPGMKDSLIRDVEPLLR